MIVILPRRMDQYFSKKSSNFLSKPLWKNSYYHKQMRLLEIKVMIWVMMIPVLSKRKRISKLLIIKKRLLCLNWYNMSKELCYHKDENCERVVGFRRNIYVAWFIF